jgi:hypothetical protein
MDQLAIPVDVTQSGDVRTWLLPFPFLPPSKNVYDGWQPTWKSAAKQKWVRRIVKLAAELDLPQGLTRVGLSAKLWFPTARRRDPQNYAQTLWHWVPDGLVRAGVLVDDNDGAIEFPAGLGVELCLDGRVGKSAAARSRTVVSLSAMVLRRESDG